MPITAPPAKMIGRSVDASTIAVPIVATSPLTATNRLRPKRSASQPLGNAANKMHTPTISIRIAAGPAAFSFSKPSRACT